MPKAMYSYVAHKQRAGAQGAAAAAATPLGSAPFQPARSPAASSFTVCACAGSDTTLTCSKPNSQRSGSVQRRLINGTTFCIGWLGIAIGLVPLLFNFFRDE